MTIQEASERYMIPIKILKEYESWGLCGAVKKVMGAWQYGKTPAQVVLRWMRQEGIIAIPKSVHAQRIQENFAVDDFQLSPADMVQIQALDLGHSLILDVPSVNEVYRLHGIQFEQ